VAGCIVVLTPAWPSASYLGVAQPVPPRTPGHDPSAAPRAAHFNGTIAFVWWSEARYRFQAESRRSRRCPGRRTRPLGDAHRRRPV